MSRLLVVGGGLFGSLAAAHARHKGIETLVFDCGRQGAASPAAAGLFLERWATRKWHEHYVRALPVLEQLYDIRSVSFRRDDGGKEALLCIAPSAILETQPIRAMVTSVGDGWLEAAGQRHQGWVYVAAGVWCGDFLSSVQVHSKAGAAFVFAGERPARIHDSGGRQCLAFVRDAGSTYFSDGTAERDYSDEHDRQSLHRAESLGLTAPVARLWGRRPYVPGGPLFVKVASSTWLASGGRKLGTIVGASLARRLVEEELF